MIPDDLSDEEKELFHHHMQGVTPLKTTRKKHLIKPTSKHSSNKTKHTYPNNTLERHRKEKDLPPHRHETSLDTQLNQLQQRTKTIKKWDSLSSAYQEEVGAHTTLSFSRNDFPNKRLRELKKGLIRWQAKLDLHGLRGEDAQKTLLAFLSKQLSQHHRCVLVIHGKGGMGTEAPVLKNLLNHWLKQISAVLAFHSATPRDGGTGAVYIFLQRPSER